MNRLVVALAEPARNFMGRTPTRGVAHAFDLARGSVIHTFAGELVVTDQGWPPGGPDALRHGAATGYVICLSCRVMSRPR